MKKSHFDRVVLVILDSVGIGASDDAAQFGDQKSNTLKHIDDWCKQNNKAFHLPNLERWGLGNILTFSGAQKVERPDASLAILEEVSPGKDTTTGHWEIAGTPLTKQFPTYPAGFPFEVLSDWAQKNSLNGWLCNAVGSGTQVLDDYGLEHMNTGKPIVYTSADSVWQIAAHEETFGLKKLHQICESARDYADKLGLGRVIARPFLGDKPNNFKRTENRRDYSETPPTPNMLDIIKQQGGFVGGVGKIDDIFAHRSITLSDHTGRNETSKEAILKMLKETEGKRGLIFANLIDFDQLYGHRRDPSGYADCLMAFDNYLPRLEKAIDPNDLLIISADHGNDPTHAGTDHTRELVPLLFWSPSTDFKARSFGKQRGFHHIARLCLEALNMDEQIPKLSQFKETKSFLKIGENK